MKKTYSNRYNKYTKKNNYVNNFITRVLISIIVFFSILIYTNNKENLKTFKKYALDSHISFAKINKLYNKYLGVVVPTKKEAITAFKEKSDTSLKAYENGYIKNNKNKDVNAIKEGIVVSITKDKNNKHTIIVQGIDEIDYTYGYLDSKNVNMYDYVSKGTVLGHTDDLLYLSFKKGNIYLKYEELNQNK